MVGLVSALVGEIAYEVVRFVIMLALLVLAVFVGGKLRKAADAKKAAKMAASENKEKEIKERFNTFKDSLDIPASSDNVLVL